MTYASICLCEECDWVGDTSECEIDIEEECYFYLCPMCKSEKIYVGGNLLTFRDECDRKE